MRPFLILFLILNSQFVHPQTNLVTYAGNTGKETFYDVMQLTDGTFLVTGYSTDLNWVAATVPKIQLTYPGTIPNALGTNKYGFLLHLSADMQQILQVVHLPRGAVEDIRFIKTSSKPYTPTGDLFISCNTADSDANSGGYVIAKLNNNFVRGIPTALTWVYTVAAKSGGPKDTQPWDVTNSGEVVCIVGEAHGYNWSAVYWLDNMGKRKVVNDWRTHWLKTGTEWRGTPASAAVGGTAAVDYSGIVLKTWGRCDLRSWTMADYIATTSDGNGGRKKGKWPLDVLFSGPCDPLSPTAVSPGYTGYSQASCCPVYGGSSICIDRTNNNLYIGMNFKTVSNAANGNSPDFEPAVIAMDTSGKLRWWSRLYHEISPAGDTLESIPDQYVDALAIDYTNGKLVVGARAHGNNVENLWEGNTINADPTAYGFQNRFTGSNGNIHESWLGKLRLTDGTLTNSTYMGELFEGTASLGSALVDPNMDGWPNPNSGWPDLNTTRMAKNALKVSSNGSVCVLASGRRTMTTANAYQKNVNPLRTGMGSWNSFVRVYDDKFHAPLYSSLIVGQWNTTTGAGGDNTEIFGVYKTDKGVICVGRQTADTLGVANGNNLPTTNIPAWGTSTPQNETAILVYYQATNINTQGDKITSPTTEITESNRFQIFPNPATNEITISTNESIQSIAISNTLGQTQLTFDFQDAQTTRVCNVSSLTTGIYWIVVNGIGVKKLMIK
jgi:Secretion system C-terminal sorting domain